MTITATPAEGALALDDLRSTLSGVLLEPGDPDYERLATPWNVAVPSRPLAVIAAVDAADVQATVRFANRAGLRVDVRRTGHGATHDGAGVLLVHTGRLDELDVHPDGRARLGAGVLWSDVIAAAAPLGLLPVCGSAPGVGAVGFLTGGGIGPTARTHGVGSDHVRAIEVVTGDGELRRATADQNPALFWGLRGGKGALGIVTAVELDLIPLSTLFGGAAYFGEPDIARMLHAWSAWTSDLDERGTSSAAIVRLPPMPGMPPQLAGRTTLAIRFAWTGDPAEGAAAIAPLLGAVAPVLGGYGEMPAGAIGAIHADPVDPMPVQDSAALLRALPGEAVDALLAVAGPEADCPQVIVEVRALGGAVARGGAAADALDHRSAALVLSVIGIAAGPIAEATARSAEAILAAAEPWTMEGALPNFAAADDPETARRVYRPETLGRLATLSATFDPRGVIRAALPVREAAESAAQPSRAAGEE